MMVVILELLARGVLREELGEILKPWIERDGRE